jgi:hypothetical protein
MTATQMFRQRPFVWCAMQTPGCLEECAKVGLYSSSQLAVTYDSKVSGHEDDDHQCAAVTHACGEVTVTFHLPQYYVPYLTFPAV